MTYIVNSMEEPSQLYDCIVVGGGHAGIEAAHIVAKAGFKTLLLTMNLDTIGKMSCNPSIGGVAKGHITREVDALGGLMGKIIDETCIHSKMLNRSKGPAVWGPRAQADKTKYSALAKKMIEQTSNLFCFQDNASNLIVKNNQVCGVMTSRGKKHLAKYVILTTGTFLNGLIHLGKNNFSAGRMGDNASQGLSNSLREFDISVGRLKTGTPPRIDAKTINFAKLEEQHADSEPQPFSYRYEYNDLSFPLKQIPCYITYTNEKLHTLIRENLTQSPMYSGQIKSTGPRYCPSIEDKVVRFSDKNRHQVFLEPEGLDTTEVYCNGISTSLPEEIQLKIVRMISGLEDAHIMRPGYAVEYDYIAPTQLTPWLEMKKIPNLFCAGQINGTTGYEEAAGQGLIAGYNVIHKLKKLKPFVLKRDESYIGVLIDDLVTKGVDEPYRMFTSRAEFRLYLRQDNADRRLMKYAFRHALDDGIYSEMLQRYKLFYGVKRSIVKKKVGHDIRLASERFGQNVQLGSPLKSLLRRPQFSDDNIINILKEVHGVSDKEKLRLVSEIKYDGYIRKERKKNNTRLFAEKRIIPTNFDYAKIEGLKFEARQKLQNVRPFSIGQAARIPGVDPSDIDILLVHLNDKKKNKL